MLVYTILPLSLDIAGKSEIRNVVWITDDLTTNVLGMQIFHEYNKAKIVQHLSSETDNTLIVAVFMS